MMDSVTGSGR